MVVQPSMQIHASVSWSFLKGSFDILILNTTSEDSGFISRSLPTGEATQHIVFRNGLWLTAPHREPDMSESHYPSLGFPPEDTAEIHNTLPGWWGGEHVLSSDHYIHYTSTFTYLPNNVSCPMPWHEWDATCEPGHFKCTECPQRSHYWGNLQTGDKGLMVVRTHASSNMHNTQLERLRLLYHKTRHTRGALTSKGGRQASKCKHLESRFTSTKFYCYQYTFIYNVKVFQKWIRQGKSNERGLE